MGVDDSSGLDDDAGSLLVSYAQGRLGMSFRYFALFFSTYPSD